MRQIKEISISEGMNFDQQTCTLSRSFHLPQKVSWNALRAHPSSKKIFHPDNEEGFLVFLKMETIHL
jgi:hypothetical protein